MVDKLANAAYLHPAQKPIELYERPIEYHTMAGDVVLEPFTGSGTQFVAAEKLGRVCYGMEIDRKYVDTTLQRWSAFTGRDPVREDGIKWSELVARS
jgi:DNA modification methylase